MLPTEKVDQFFSTLVARTKDGEIKWRPDETVRHQFNEDEECLGVPFVAPFQGNQKLRLARVRYKYWVPQDALSSILRGVQENRWEWSTKVVLDLVEGNGKLLWRFPADGAIGEIFPEVQFQALGIEASIDTFLSEN